MKSKFLLEKALDVRLNYNLVGMPVEFKIPKVMAAKGKKRYKQCSSGSKPHVSILACASISGQAYHHWWYLLVHKHFNTRGEVPASLYGMCSSG